MFEFIREEGFMAQPGSSGMNAIENMDEVRFPNIYILSHIIYYIHQLTVITALAIKRVRILAMQEGDIKE